MSLFLYDRMVKGLTVMKTGALTMNQTLIQMKMLDTKKKTLKMDYLSHQKATTWLQYGYYCAFCHIFHF